MTLTPAEYDRITNLIGADGIAVLMRLRNRGGMGSSEDLAAELGWPAARVVAAIRLCLQAGVVGSPPEAN